MLNGDLARMHHVIHKLGLRDAFVVALEGSGDKIIGGAEIGGPDDFRLAVDALALAGVVIGFAVNSLGGEASHGFHPCDG